MPRQARHPEAEGSRGADLPAEFRGHLPAVPQGPGDGAEVQAARREGDGGVRAERPRDGVEEVGADRQRGLHRLPRQPRHPAGGPAPVGHPPPEDPHDVREVPSRDPRAVRKERPREGDAGGDRRIAGVHGLPRRTHDREGERPVVLRELQEHPEDLLGLPREGVDLDAVRPPEEAVLLLHGFVPRDRRGVRDDEGRQLLLLPRSARHPAVVRPGLHGQQGESPEDVREVPSQRGSQLRQGRRPRGDLPEEGDGGVRRPGLLHALHRGPGDPVRTPRRPGAVRPLEPKKGSWSGGKGGAIMSHADLEAGQVIRMSLLFRVQHLLLTVLLTVLAVTGFALMYHENSLAQWIIRLEGGVTNRGIVHRIAAVLLMANLVYHAFYMLFSREGKPELRQLFIVRQDIDDFFQSLRYNLGTAKEYPRFGKYGYKEKFQYWGASAGIILISITGIMLWAEEFSMVFFPKVVLDLAIVIHGYQGLLAFAVLFLWHLYNVHLHPSVFPMNPSWITGKVSAEWLREEHPLEYEKLKGEGLL